MFPNKVLLSDYYSIYTTEVQSVPYYLNPYIILWHTAIPGIDYTERQGSLLANSSVHGPDVNLCFEVLIVNDSFVEEEECFGVFISLSSNDLKVLIADGGNSSICCIQDDDCE